MTSNANAVYESSTMLRSATSSDLEFVFDVLDAELAYLTTRYWLTYWRAYQGLPGDLTSIEAVRTDFLLRPELQDFLVRWRGATGSSMLDRSIEIWLREVVLADTNGRGDAARLRSEIMALVLAAQQPGPDRPGVADLRRTLKESEDPARRREAWERLGSAADGLVELTRQLISVRNHHARERGHADYPSLVLGLDDLAVTEVFDVVERLHTSTIDAHLEGIRQVSARHGLDEVRDYDLPFVAFARSKSVQALFPEERLQRATLGALTELGCELGPPDIRVDVTALPYRGICIPVRNPQDVRILLAHGGGFEAYSTAFHEYGHALHWRGGRQKRSFMNYERGPICEMMAQTLALFLRHQATLERHVGLDDTALETWKAASTLSWNQNLRDYYNAVAFEVRAYTTDGVDLNALFAETSARYLGVPAEPTSHWALTPFLANYPVYRQNYILADIVAANNHRRLKDDLGRVAANPAAIAELSSAYWESGNGLPWRAKVTSFSGVGLDTDALADVLSNGSNLFDA